jgi:ribonuclease HI
VADANRIFLSPESTTNLKPSDLYNVPVNRCTAPGYRFVRSTIHNPYEMLMFVDGSALNNGSPNARAGSWMALTYFRAVLASLTLRNLAGEAFSRITIACNSEYVVKGISQWILKWRKNGWKMTSRSPAANQDLWKKLEVKFREMEKKGCSYSFGRFLGSSLKLTSMER